MKCRCCTEWLTLDGAWTVDLLTQVENQGRSERVWGRRQTKERGRLGEKEETVGEERYVWSVCREELREDSQSRGWRNDTF